jgi:UDP-N-acetylglucosamine--N-acetylmuramyl-(pentapeptide) pyrophosphoryl-undecaprenol N-acetylglucosamine transferase
LKRAVIAAGGTGGHFFPGLALAEELGERGWKTLFIVRRNDPALTALEKKGLTALEIDLRGLPRRFGAELAAFPWHVLRAWALLRRALADFSPDVVVGTGGYLSFPLIAAAAFEKIPRLVHESNCDSGLANQACSFFGADILWGLPPTSGSGKIVGTPIRRELWSLQDSAQARKKLGLAEGRPTLLVFGGSQGAAGINRALPDILIRLAKGAPDSFQILHLSGQAHAEALRKAYAKAPFTWKVEPFVSEMGAAYAAADLVLCRSGASTLAELAAQKKPAILIPFPSATGNHQEHNAKIFTGIGAARLILEPRLTEFLPGFLEELLKSADAKAKRASMSSAYGTLGLPSQPQTASMIADAVETAAREDQARA